MQSSIICKRRNITIRTICLCLLLLTASLIIASTNPSGATAKRADSVSIGQLGAPSEKRAQADYTVLIYMPGSDLESDYQIASKDLLEMMEVGSSSRVRIAVQTGGAKKWQLKQIDQDKNQRWLVQKGKLELLASQPKYNMDKKESLSEFLSWGVQQFPAKEYVLILWGHGLGPIDGYGGDEWYGNKKMKLDTLASALEDVKRATGVTWGLIGFDACKMATLETAYALRQYGDYLVASVDYTNINGWDYRTVLRVLQERPSMEVTELGKIIADSYDKHSQSRGEAEDRQYTVIRLDKVEDVVQTVERFASTLTRRFEHNSTYGKIKEIRSQSEDYADEGDLTDLVDVSSKLGRQLSVLPEAWAIREAVDEAVVYQVRTPEHPRSKGISIYFPQLDKQRFIQKSNLYEQLDFSPSYQALIRSYSNWLHHYYYPDKKRGIAYWRL